MATYIDLDKFRERFGFPKDCYDCEEHRDCCRYDRDFTRMDICGLVDEADYELREDVVPVVRCKDCVHCGFCGEATNLGVMGFNGYCSRGERRGE